MVLVILSLAIGSVRLSPYDILLAWQGGSSPTTQAILDQRVSRTVLGLLVGLSLGVSGALMQALTRNLLAEPGILGVNSGAGFTVTLAVAFLGIADINSYIWFSFMGALLATLLVYFFSCRPGLGNMPVRLVLVGMALGSVLMGVSRTIALINPVTFDALRFWGAGTLANRPDGTISTILPFVAIGFFMALSLGRSLDFLSLGEDAARSQGVNVAVTQVLAMCALTLLCGAATAAAGPIAFVGLIVPHIARSLVGVLQFRVLLLSALLAPVVLLGADILGRVVVSPRELQVGVLASAVGAPVLIYLVWRVYKG
ncbi:MAG: iron chelate uptake ABC transporter family permease subunit [Rothia sp. (in: high G+C Gram-positive bacteria)]|nr:iron chelate uptake ABC transporter family permease subunit [Rothia sp. (in: high G+C Gram-positive bacteria)]